MKKLELKYRELDHVASINILLYRLGVYGVVTLRELANKAYNRHKEFK